MNPFAAISGGAGGVAGLPPIASSSNASSETGGAGGFGFGAVNTGTQGIDGSYIGAALAVVVVAYLVTK